MTYQEIISALKESGIKEYDFAHQYNLNKLPESIKECKEIEQVGGEGEGEHWHSVKYFSQHDVYIKITGFYTSYDGSEFDGFDSSCQEVKPTQKTITVYE